MDNIVVEAETEVKSFKCDHCAKICKSKQGLSRHSNAKHKGEKEEPLLNKAEMKLHQGVFWKFVKDSAAKLAEDDCYSDTTKQVFSNFSLTLEESNSSYRYIEKSILDFNGNAEKFYQQFYDSFCNNPMFPGLNRKCSRLLGCEVANHVLVHLNSRGKLSSTSVKTPVLTVNSIEFTEKEQNIIAYLSGYVFHTVHKRLCRSRSHSSDVKEKYLALLAAGKKSNLGDQFQKPNEQLISVKNRGGL